MKHLMIALLVGGLLASSSIAFAQTPEPVTPAQPAPTQPTKRTRDNGMYWGGVILSAVGGWYVGWDLGTDHSESCVTTFVGNTAFQNCSKPSHNKLYYGLALIGTGTAFQIASYKNIAFGPGYIGYRKSW